MPYAVPYAMPCHAPCARLHEAESSLQHPSRPKAAHGASSASTRRERWNTQQPVATKTALSLLNRAWRLSQLQCQCRIRPELMASEHSETSLWPAFNRPQSSCSACSRSRSRKRPVLRYTSSSVSTGAFLDYLPTQRAARSEESWSPSMRCAVQGCFVPDGETRAELARRDDQMSMRRRCRCGGRHVG